MRLSCFCCIYYYCLFFSYSFIFQTFERYELYFLVVAAIGFFFKRSAVLIPVLGMQKSVESVVVKRSVYL